MMHILESFATISLDEMKSVKLMNRLDTKYVTSYSKLSNFFELAKDDYMVQEISGKIVMDYFTRYFDTPECNMYRSHLHGKKKRRKVRIRRYESGQEFLEVKLKNNKGRTDKRRISTETLSEADYSNFIIENGGEESEKLIPHIEVAFSRITLVNRNKTERLTIDTNLRYRNVVTNCSTNLEGIVIIELKRNGRKESPILNILKALRIHPSGFSKYCIGMALTNSKLPANLLKERLRMINKIRS